MFSCLSVISRSKRGASDVPPPFGVHSLSFSCSFRQNSCKITKLAYILWELALPQENPGSANVSVRDGGSPYKTVVLALRPTMRVSPVPALPPPFPDIFQLVQLRPHIKTCSLCNPYCQRVGMWIQIEMVSCFEYNFEIL